MMRKEQCTDQLHLKTHVRHHHVHRESLRYLIQAVHSWLLDDARVELAKRRYFHLLKKLVREARDSGLQG